MPQSQFPGSSFTVVETGAQNGRAVTGPVSGVEGAVASGGREDLTVFFTIGVIANVLLVTVFLVWAVGQWRKKKK
ncbi:MAG: hypothetical protein BMS9Abin09_0890 [Gammaproteobacteria bacterium]|nr:MAG: hypothetical protein BMS9Abin09_0890 [Gammaproteobacteria bacterium]